jgi:hypothetical protein
MLIGFRETRKLTFKVGYFKICEPEVKVVEFVYGGLLGQGSEENCETLVREVMRLLDNGGTDLALWSQLDVKSPLYRSAIPLPRFAGRDHSCCFQGHWSVNFPRGLDSFFINLSRTQRSKLRRKYIKNYEPFHRKDPSPCFRSLEDLAVAISDMETIACKTKKWQVFGAGFVDSLQIPTVRSRE